MTDTKLIDLPGGNIHTASSMIRGVVNRLESVAATPVDMADKVIKIMTTSSVPKFNTVFSSLETFKDIGIMPEKEFRIEMLLNLAESKYVSLYGSGEWTLPVLCGMISESDATC